jgi:hypothetical protein
VHVSLSGLQINNDDSRQRAKKSNASDSKWEKTDCRHSQCSLTAW